MRAIPDPNHTYPRRSPAMQSLWSPETEVLGVWSNRTNGTNYRWEPDLPALLSGAYEEMWRMRRTP
jgi:hypothetical protein